MKIKTDDEAISIIADLQNVIKEQSRYDLRFVFEVREHLLYLTVPRRFTFEMRDKKQKPVKIEFSGKNFIEVVNSFLYFFQEGNECKIAVDENSLQYCVQFSYKNKWVVNNYHLDHYSYTDSFDD